MFVVRDSFASSTNGGLLAEKRIRDHHEREAVALAGRRVLQELSGLEVGEAATDLQLRRVGERQLRVDLLTDVAPSRAGGGSSQRCTAGAVERIGDAREPVGVVDTGDEQLRCG